MIAYLDACIIIYWVETAEPFYSNFVEKMNKLRQKYGKFSFAASELSLLECRVKPLRDKNDTLLNYYQQFFTSSDLTLLPINLSVIELATQIRVNYKIATPDALQAASAFSFFDDFIFLTSDTTFKKIKNLKTIII